MISQQEKVGTVTNSLKNWRKGIPFDDDIQLNWNFDVCSNDYAYFKYGQFEELILSSDLDNDYVSHKELGRM